MTRREAYGTSGTRPTLRFFGTWDASFDASLCESSNLVERAYESGVPMGGALPQHARASGPPRFIVTALRDPDPSAAPLERIEIVKGWVEDGETKTVVVDAVGGPNGSDVDLRTCERRGKGADQLCNVWTDERFEPDQPAVYYARLRENPSCRWSQWACVDAGVDCEDPSSTGQGYELCCSADHARTIQERAWSSPIWYSPNSE